MKKDCNKAEEFLSEWSRMCKTKDKCENCPFYDTDNICNTLKARINYNTIKNSIETVQKWSDEHPDQTMLEKFFEMFPNALKDKDGTPNLCLSSLGWIGVDFEKCLSTGDCKECWNRPYKEN